MSCGGAWVSPWFVGLVSSFVVGQYNFVKQDVYTRDTVLVEVHALMYYSINDVRKVTATVPCRCRWTPSLACLWRLCV